MKSYHAEKGGGFASLVVKEHDIPTPGPHEVVVRVKGHVWLSPLQKPEESHRWRPLHWEHSSVS